MKAFAKKLKNIYLLSFCIPFLGILGIFIARGVYPFGTSSFMFSDMYHQYVPFLTEFVRKLRDGESLAYSWYVGLGSDFTSIYAYYLASPVYWFAVLCPQSLLIEYMTFFCVVKIGLCGMTFAFYLSRRFQTKDLRIVWFSVFYALSGFVAAYNWNHMWLDCLWLAPLVILGLEELVKNGRYRLYCISLCAAIFTNYYLSIMLCIFLVLYFLLQLFTNGLHFRKKLQAVLRFGIFSLLA
ncbi:MAG: YfhO family protein, partial [Lachnospiraceae bacterium]|nr:YfhO family protein [Lachnospiraceae bacterium]